MNSDIHFKEENHYFIPELGINGGYTQAMNKLIEITWRPNRYIHETYLREKQRIKLPQSYVGCQIRGGDKITETTLLSPDYFISAIKKHSNTQNIFVLTDDFRIYKYLTDKYPEFQIYTLCSETEQGYVNKDFCKSAHEDKRSQMLRFITSIQILMESETSIVSITTGPSLFLLLKLYPRAKPIDCSADMLTCLFTKTIAERGSISQRFIKDEVRNTDNE